MPYLAGKNRSVLDLNSIEKVLSLYLKFRPMVPTPIEFTRMLLFLIDNSQDYPDDVALSTDYCFVAMSNFEAAVTFTQSAISIASLMIAFEELEYEDFEEAI